MNWIAMRTMAAVCAAGLLACVCMSCATGRPYERPSLATPEQYKSTTPGEQAQPELGQDWWRLFQDDDLNALVEQALAANQNVRAAVARLDQSRASSASARSSLFPTISASPSASRTRSPGTSYTTTDASGAEVTKTASGTTNTALRIPFDLSYELDIWGRVRHACEEAEANVKVSEYDLEVVRQTLLADLAQDYFQVRSLDAQDEILTRNLALYQEQTDLTQHQVDAGLVNETNVLQARVQLETTRVQLDEVRRERADLEHAIAILLGRAPSDFSLAVRPLTGMPPVIPAGLPSELLRRRPDVAKAEQNLVAACAAIGVAEANFFPVLSLTGSTGFESADLSSILNWQQRTWSFGPSLALPLFKGGQLRASLRKAEARYEELQAAYRETALGAFGDVENYLTDLHARATESDTQEKAVSAAREYLKLTQIQYNAGTINYLQMIDAEQTLLTNELSAAKILNQRMASTVLLIKAVGGGWNAQPAVSTEASTPDAPQAAAKP